MKAPSFDDIDYDGIDKAWKAGNSNEYTHDRLLMSTVFEYKCDWDGETGVGTFGDLCLLYYNQLKVKDDYAKLRVQIPQEIAGRDSQSWAGVIRFNQKDEPIFYDSAYSGKTFKARDYSRPDLMRHMFILERGEPLKLPYSDGNSDVIRLYASNGVAPPPIPQEVTWETTQVDLKPTGDLDTLITGISLNNEEMLSQIEDVAKEGYKWTVEGLFHTNQISMINAAPNSGKTLITLSLLKQSIADGLIDGNKVVFFDMDDDPIGAYQKYQAVKDYGIKFIFPYLKGSTVSMCTDLMYQLGEHDLHGYTFVLDTIRQFTDIMSSEQQKEFMQHQMMPIIAAGGTIIINSHINKTRDSSGKGIMAGTADLLNDVSCVYLVDVDENAPPGLQRVTFENVKSRGINEREVTFVFENEGDWTKKFESVTRLNDNDMAAQEQYESEMENQDVIAITKEVLEKGECKTGELVDAITFKIESTKSAKVSKSKIRAILKEYIGVHWVMETKGLASVYSLMRESRSVEKPEYIKTNNSSSSPEFRPPPTIDDFNNVIPIKQKMINKVRDIVYRFGAGELNIEAVKVAIPDLDSTHDNLLSEMDGIEWDIVDNGLVTSIKLNGARSRVPPIIKE